MLMTNFKKCTDIGHRKSMIQLLLKHFQSPTCALDKVINRKRLLYYSSDDAICIRFPIFIGVYHQSMDGYLKWRDNVATVANTNAKGEPIRCLIQFLIWRTMCRARARANCNCLLYSYIFFSFSLSLTRSLPFCALISI